MNEGEIHDGGFGSALPEVLNMGCSCPVTSQRHGLRLGLLLYLRYCLYYPDSFVLCLGTSISSVMVHVCFGLSSLGHLGSSGVFGSLWVGGTHCYDKLGVPPLTRATGTNQAKKVGRILTGFLLLFVCRGTRFSGLLTLHGLYDALTLAYFCFPRQHT